MSPHPKSIAALFAVFLALCAMTQLVKAQQGQVERGKPYYYSDSNSMGESSTVMLKVESDDAVSGMYAKGGRECYAVYAINGVYDQNTQLVSGTLTALVAPVAPVCGPNLNNDRIEGTFDPIAMWFALQFTKPGASAPHLIYERIPLYTGAPPLVAGLWTWRVDDDLSNRVFGDRFYIYEQRQDGAIFGTFSQNEGGGSIAGKVTAGGDNVIDFTRSYLANNDLQQVIRQNWLGSVVNNGQTIQGRVTQQNPPFNGAFVAAPYP